MVNQLLLLSLVTYLVILSVGFVLNKYLKLPWMFTVVVFGIILSSFSLFGGALKSETFGFLSQIGMLFFLLTIGLDLDLHEIKKMGKLIIIGDILLTLGEGFLLALFFYFVTPDFVSHSFFVALITGIAFGTVGEVILLAILKEFKLENTRFGQLALGIGIFDDIFEIFILAIIVALPGLTGITEEATAGFSSSLQIVGILIGIFAATYVVAKLGKKAQPLFSQIARKNDFWMPFFIMFVFFLFIIASSTKFSNLGVVAAIFSGVAIKEILPETMLNQLKKPLFFVARIFLGPFFFLKLGTGITFQALFSNPWLVLVIILITLVSRTAISYLLFRKTLGNKESVVLGIGLCSKFSTSVISENLLFTSGLIAAPLYSAIMVAFILLKPIVIGTFSNSVASLQDKLNPALTHDNNLPDRTANANAVLEAGD